MHQDHHLRIVRLPVKHTHFASYTSDGRFEYDETFEAFKQRYICSPAVAAAEDNGMLMDFIETYTLFSKTPKGHHHSATPNFTRLSMSNLPCRIAGQ